MVKTKIGEFVPVLTPIHSLRSIPFGSERRERTALGSDDRREEKSAEGLIKGTSSLMASSMGTGAIFSPPAVIINSARKM